MARETLNWLTAVLFVTVAGCSSSKHMSGFGNDDRGGGASGGGSPSSGGGGTFLAPPTNPSTLVVGMMAMDDADAATDAEPMDPNCPPDVHTTVSGVVYDPGFQDPLFNISVFAPKSLPLNTLLKGASCNTCESLFPPFYGSASTDSHGHFVLPNVPPGTNVPIVVQTGKWRKTFMIPHVTKCIDNPQPDKTLRLPRNGTTDGDLPDIAISTGGSDSLECLLLRMGVDAAEWTPGPGGTGHIHIFRANGSDTAIPAPVSSMSLWGPAPSFPKYDLTLLSCEGGETNNLADPDRQALLDYANAGGRVFASHFHYFWFTGQPQGTGPFAALNLATWTVGQNALDDNQFFMGNVVTSLLNGAPFPEGVAMNEWLGYVNALTGGQLPIYYTRHNADLMPPLGPPVTPSQPWINLDKNQPATYLKGGAWPSLATMYLSFDTPVNAPQKCGRVVYSDLHVTGGPGKTEPMFNYFIPDFAMGRGIVPTECAMHPLTPQEKALEFMLFDLTSCLIPIGQHNRPPK